MFTTTPSSHPADLFSNYASHFRESKRKKLNDPKTWHNVFYDHVTSKVDEPVFSVLYSASRGRPNASIRIPGCDADSKGRVRMERREAF